MEWLPAEFLERLVENKDKNEEEIYDRIKAGNEKKIKELIDKGNECLRRRDEHLRMKEEIDREIERRNIISS